MSSALAVNSSAETTVRNGLSNTFTLQESSSENK